MEKNTERYKKYALDHAFGISLFMIFFKGPGIKESIRSVVIIGKTGH